MSWKKTLTVIFLVSLSLSAFSSAFGLAYWTPLKASNHARIRLDSADQLLKFAGVVNRSVIYSFDVFWPMQPGKTRVQAWVEGIACPKENYTIEIVTMDGRVFNGTEISSFVIERKDPFMYFHVKLVIPPSCTVLPSRDGPGVVIDAKKE